MLSEEKEHFFSNDKNKLRIEWITLLSTSCHWDTNIFGTVHCYPYDGSSGKSISVNMAAEYSSQRFWSLGLCLYIFDTVLVRFNKDPILMSPINIDYQRYLGIIYIVS